MIIKFGDVCMCSGDVKDCIVDIINAAHSNNMPVREISLCDNEKELLKKEFGSHVKNIDGIRIV